MKKLWENELHTGLSAAAEDFNSSIAVDGRMLEQDIAGSTAHAAMLAYKGIISVEDGDKIICGLSEILSEFKSGKLAIDTSAEDVHTFVENELIEKIGAVGKKLHTARSRNDQVALDTRMYVSKEISEIKALLKKLIEVICDKAQNNLDAVMSGYTHLQQAQPVTFAHWLTAYGAMFVRDIDRLSDCDKRVKISPLGSCALAGTSFDTDRAFVADKLGFLGISINSMDGVSDRDFVIELAADISLVMMHLSRFSEELILFSSSEFKYVTMPEDYSTGSSIMPQKKNPDIAELVRGKTGRTYGNLITLLTVMKALPLAYNKDMQEDKEAVFDSIDTVKACLSVFAPMLNNLTVNKDKMLENADKGFICATEVADYLVKKGMEFRAAYAVAAGLVKECIESNCTLQTLPFCLYKNASELFDEDVYEAVDIKNAVQKKTSEGGPSEKSVMNIIERLKKLSEEEK